MMSALEVMCCLLQLIICGIMNQFFGFLDRTHLFENQEISSYEGFNVMPRRIPDFPDSFHSWNFLSSIGSGITFLSFAMFSLFIFIPPQGVSPSNLCKSSQTEKRSGDRRLVSSFSTISIL